jgi:hypothetical protein
MLLYVLEIQAWVVAVRLELRGDRYIGAPPSQPPIFGEPSEGLKAI